MKRLYIFALASISAALISNAANAQDSWAGIAADVSDAPQTQPRTTSVLTLRNGGYDKALFQFVVEYVNKSWLCEYADGTKDREDFFGDTDAKYFHGWGFGGLYTPSFDWGLGLRTGVFLETYLSRSKWITDFCNHFSELDMYIPVQASYRIPFAEDIALDIYAGIGFQWAIEGRYYKYVGTQYYSWRRPVRIYDTKKQEYGNGWPKRVNWQADLGLNFRYKDFGIAFTYSFGLTDHGIQTTSDGGQTYETATRSRQDKMQAAVSFYF